MEQLIQAFLNALEAAGIPAVSALSGSSFPQLTQAACAVSVSSAGSTSCGFYEYLGMTNQGTQAQQERYGRQLKATVSLAVCSPGAQGGAVCTQAANTVLELLLRGVPGVQLGELHVEKCRYDAHGDYFVCPVTAEALAYVYAAPTPDGTAFTDFSLKGAIS